MGMARIVSGIGICLGHRPRCVHRVMDLHAAGRATAQSVACLDASLQRGLPMQVRPGCNLPHFRQSSFPTSMRRLSGFFAVLMFAGCAKVVSVERLPDITLSEATFFPTIEAHTDAPIVSGNRIDVLLNGDETFPVMLRDIKAAK